VPEIVLQLKHNHQTWTHPVRAPKR